MHSHKPILAARSAVKSGGKCVKSLYSLNVDRQNLSFKNICHISLFFIFVLVWDVNVNVGIFGPGGSFELRKEEWKHLTLASKIWNQLPTSLKDFFSVKHFSNKLKKFLQVADVDSILVFHYGRVCLPFIIYV